MRGFKRELARKAFHLLSLGYLAAYWVLPVGAYLALLGCWILVEGSVEFLRLRRPEVNALVFRVFGGIHRESELRRVSGVFWTSLGCWTSVLLFHAEPRAVSMGILCLAFGDAAAALVGRAAGRIPIGFGGRTKTLEGTAACFGACLAAGWGVGLEGPALYFAAAAAAAVELLPVPLDDNFWLPVVPAAIVRYLA